MEKAGYLQDVAGTTREQQEEAQYYGQSKSPSLLPGQQQVAASARSDCGYRDDTASVLPGQEQALPSSSNPKSQGNSNCPPPLSPEPSVRYLHQQSYLASSSGHDSHSHGKQETESSQEKRESRPILLSSASDTRQNVSSLKTFNQLAFIGTIGLQSGIVLALIASIYGVISSGKYTAAQTFTASPQLESVATYLALFILAEVFQLLVTLDALTQRNILQLIFLLPFQLAILVYSTVLPSQIAKALLNTYSDTPRIHSITQALAIVIPSVIGFFTFVLCGLTWRLYGELGWYIFKTLGADIRIRKLYATYQFFITILKFQAFFFVGFCIQFLVLVQGTPRAEFAITIAALPIGILFLVLAAYFARLEIRWGMYSFFFVESLGMAYFLYKIVAIYNPAEGERYSSAKASLTIFGALSLVMLLTTFFTTGAVLLNFGQGLKEHIPPYTFLPNYRRKTADLGQSSTGLDPGTGARMSLD